MKTLPEAFDPTGCQCSEKYDGIQGRWDGAALTTRTGNRINAPNWWTATLPNEHLVGELWIGRGTFQILQSIVTRETPDERWNQVRFVDFKKVKQTKVESPQQLESIYRNIVDNGGEGVVITDKAGESFKKKPLDDDDGILVGVVPGAGKQTGMVGALILKTRDDRTVKVSAGLTLALRKNPPAKGAIVRFKHNGVTSTGLPRFARFDGLRAETSLAF